jgi:hypothetical protein
VPDVGQLLHLVQQELPVQEAPQALNYLYASHVLCDVAMKASGTWWLWGLDQSN